MTNRLPIAIVAETLPLEYVVMGFSQTVSMQIVFDGPVAGLFCFKFRGVLYHMPVITAGRETRETAWAIISNREEAVKKCCDIFLASDVETRKTLEVTSEHQ